MEHLKPPAMPVEEVEPAAVPGGQDPARLKVLLARASRVEEWDQKRVAGEINALLVAMRAPGNEAAEAKAVLEQLDLGALDGLVDEDGRICRAEAVETLLACGYPHALEVRPEDLDHHRAAAEPASPGALLVVGLAATAILLLVGTVLVTRVAPAGATLELVGGVVAALATCAVTADRVRRKKAAKNTSD